MQVTSTGRVDEWMAGWEIGKVGWYGKQMWEAVDQVDDLMGGSLKWSGQVGQVGCQVR